MKGLSAFEQAKQALTKPVTTIAKFAGGKLLDAPFAIASAKQAIAKRVFPNIPFPSDEFVGDENQTRSPWMAMLNSNLFPPVEAGESAYTYPYVTPPQGDIPRAEIADILARRGFRPAAINYLSQLPVKVGEQYLSPIPDRTTLGTAYPQQIMPSSPFFAGVSPNMESRQQFEDVVTHELLHQSPRLPFLDPRGVLGRLILQRLQPNDPNVRGEMTNRWGPQYMTARPSGVEEEMFAERMLPDVFYKHLLNQ